VETVNITQKTTTYLIVMMVLMPFHYAHSQSDTNGTFTLNLQNADIRSVIETVSLRTGRNFIVDPRIKATVTVISSEPINGDKLYEIFLSILDVHGYAAVPAGEMIKIVPASVGVQSPIPVLEDQPRPDDQLITRVIALENKPTQQMIDALRPLISATGSLSAEAITNTVIITDQAANIDKVAKIIRLLDKTN